MAFLISYFISTFTSSVPSIPFLVPRNDPAQNRAHHARQGRELGKWLSLAGVELQRDFERSGRFGNFVGRLGVLI